MMMQDKMIQEKIETVLENLTLEEKVRLLSGQGSWHTYDCNGKIPAIMMTDGPHGLRKQENEDFADVNRSEIATCFPTASAMASTWDEKAVGKMAEAIAHEARKEKVSIVLGCGMNMKRSPLCGRNFEYFSEDPCLAGTLATSYVNHMQALGVGTSVKHFAVNNQETRRQSANSQIDERALREIYLSAFEQVVKKAKPTTIMASYNRLNGEYVCANQRILTDILRKEWGFEGTIVSDWGAAVDIEKCVKAGMDLEMPDSSGIHTAKLLEAIEKGRIQEADIDRAARKVLELILTQTEKLVDETVDYDKQHQIARELETEAAVLLKNNQILPLARGTNVIVIGELAENMRFQGGGSSHITTKKTKNALLALQEKGLQVTYAKGYTVDSMKPNRKLEKEAISVLDTTADGTIVLFFGGLTEKIEGEGFDRDNLAIPKNQLELLDKVYEKNSNIVFVSFGGAPMEMPFLPKVKAVLQMYLGGQAVGEACADLLLGDKVPCGKLAETFPSSIADVPSTPYFAKETDDVEYRESLFIGYRYYDTFHKKTLFDFGYGLSYSSFTYTDLQVAQEKASQVVKPIYQGGSLEIAFYVENTGSYEAKEIAEVYIKNPKGKYIRAKRELRGFSKVALKPGERKKIIIQLDDRSFSIYDVKAKQFVMPSGTYEIQVGAALNDIRLTQEIEVQGISYEVDDTKRYSDYFAMEETGTTGIRREQFETLLGRSVSHFDDVKKGEFTTYHTFGKVAGESFLGSIILSLVKHIMRRMNKGKAKDDPALHMLLQGIQDGPLDVLVCESGGMFPMWIAEAVVMAANGHSMKAIGYMLKGGK